MQDMRLLSVQVGPIETYGEFDSHDPLDRRWTSAIFKKPQIGSVNAGWLGLEGDSQADPRFHGGRDKAVLAYAVDHFSHWRQQPGLEEMNFGGFGENLSITGQSEENVCIGDAWRVGEVLLEITQPRQPCWKLGLRWRQPELPKRVIARGWTGWYYRVLDEGRLEAGQSLSLERRVHPEWTIVEANRVMYTKRGDAGRTRALIALPELSQAWKDELGERVMV
jgi:MOSC domain-containing protein YiiM